MENVLNAMRRENDARVASLPPGYRETAQRMGKRLALSLPVVAWVAFAMLLLSIPSYQQWEVARFSVTDVIVVGWMTAWVLYFSTYPKKWLVRVLWVVVMLQWSLMGSICLITRFG